MIPSALKGRQRLETLKEKSGTGTEVSKRRSIRGKGGARSEQPERITPKPKGGAQSEQPERITPKTKRQKTQPPKEEDQAQATPTVDQQPSTSTGKLRLPITLVSRVPDAMRVGEAYLLQVAATGMGMKGRYITGANANTPEYWK